jgi:hypothetical protein
MRVGVNPNRDTKIEQDYFHQVIIPLYIPNTEDYYKDAFRVFKISIISLIKSSHGKTFITIVNNGSCDEVKAYLNDLYNQQKIQEIIHSVNIGRVNASLKGISGHDFDFVTLSDGDVLFLNGWQKATYSVFKSFPKTGMVCPTPSSRSYNNYTFNIWFSKLFSKKLKFSSVKDKQALINFAKSLDNLHFYKKCHLEQYLTISNNESSAVVGAGHFIATYRADILNSLKTTFTPFKMGGNSNTLIDASVVKKGYWRLSTENNYARHMGNVYEGWMDNLLDKQEFLVDYNDLKFYSKPKKYNLLKYFFEYKLMSKLMSYKFFRKLFLRYKGLKKTEVNNY